MNANFIDPILISLGPLQVRWYGLMYVCGFLFANYFFKKLVKEGFFHIALEAVDSLITYCIIGLFFGARLFYVFIYNWDYYQNHLSKLLAVWEGGLSFHGGVVGIGIAFYLFSKRHKISHLQVYDSAVLAGSLGVFFGRLGNFINGELYGRITNVPWAMVFNDAGPLPRHPSQIYQALGEGLSVFVLIWFLRKKVTRHGMILALYLSLYAVFRFIAEFFREPDPQLGHYFGYITMGQILCFIMFIIGILLFVWSLKKGPIIEYKKL